MNRKLKVISAVAICAVLAQIHSNEVIAANSYIPEINVYQQGSSPKVEIGIAMANEDVWHSYSMTSSNWDLNDSANSYGKQSLTQFDGEAVYKIGDTVTNSEGNWFGDPLRTPTSTSRLSDKTKNTFNYGSWVSITYYARVDAGSSDQHLGPRAYGRVPPNDSYTMLDNSGRKILYSSNTDFMSKPSKIYLKTASGDRVNLADEQQCLINVGKFGYATFIWYRWNQDGQYLYTYSGTDTSTYNSNKRKVCYANEEVRGYLEGSVGFASRAPIADSTWHVYSNNVQMNQLPESWYDYSTDGVGLDFANHIRNGNMYIKGVKFGRASKVQVMRDGGTVVYDGYGSDVTDSGIVVTPSAPTVTGADTKANYVRFNFAAQNKTETHTYRARSQSNSTGEYSNWSGDYNVNLISNIQGYSVVVDKNSNTTPSANINNTNGVIDTSGYREGDVIYCHVRAVDQNGQWSTPIHYRYVVKQTASDLKSDYTSVVNALSVDNNSDINSLSAQLVGLRTNSNISYSITSGNRVNGTKYTDGSWLISTTIDGSQSYIQKTIIRRPEYQTKQELKNDITDYLGKTNYNIEKGVPTKVPYTYSVDTSKLEQDIVNKCKTNPALENIELKLVRNTATEKSKGQLEYEVILK